MGSKRYSLEYTSNKYKEKGNNYEPIFSSLIRRGEQLLRPGEDFEMANQRFLLDYRQTGDEKSRDSIVLVNMKLIIDTATKLWEDKYDLKDLVHEGIFGVYDGIDKYEESKKTKISSYLVFRIVKKIELFKDRNHHLINYSDYAIKMESKYKSSVTIENIPVDVVLATRSSSKTYLSVIERLQAVCPLYEIELADDNERKNESREYFSDLLPYERQLIASYHGQFAFPEVDKVSFSKACTTYNISQATGRQIVKRVTYTIKQKLAT